MKKNRMMRLASVLLVCVLLTTSVISGTFAKYTTYGEASDNARVAKWGVSVTADFTTLFGATYSEKVADSTEDGLSVESKLGGDVLAPGTSGDLVDFTVQGAPEVDVEVTYVATLELGDFWKDASDAEYCPVYFTINGDTYGIEEDCGISCDVKATDVADLEEKVKTAIEGSTKKYDAGEDLSAVANDLAVSWAWEYSTSEANDKKDTDLGNWADGEYGTISLDIKCTITQID